MEPTTTTRDETTGAVVAEQNVTAPGNADVVTELLVEEISIDGMCGVY